MGTPRAPPSLPRALPSGPKVRQVGFRQASLCVGELPPPPPPCVFTRARNGVRRSISHHDRSCEDMD